MKNYKNITVSWSESVKIAPYYDLVEKIEGVGELTANRIPIGEVTEEFRKVRYVINKDVIREHGILKE